MKHVVIVHTIGLSDLRYPLAPNFKAFVLYKAEYSTFLPD
jgi:hypothetical protein